MSKKGTAKVCICFGIVLLLASGAILAWYFLAGNDNNNDTGDDKGSKEGGLFGTGLFGGNGKNNETGISMTNGNGGQGGGNGNNNNNNLPSASSTVAPSAAPSMMPSEYRYPFYQCPKDNTTNTATTTAPQCCNGLENLCDWPVNHILFAGVHNAMATEENFLIPNNLLGVKEALEAGYRGINIDICNCMGKYQLCHGLCGFGQTDAVDTLTDLVDFLDTHPNDVVFLTMEVNSDAGQTVDLNDFYSTIMTKIDGLTEYLYVHTEQENANGRNNNLDLWPTLGSLIVNDARLLAFHWNGPTCSSQEGTPCPDGLHYYFRYFQETEFRLTSIDAILNTDNSCPITRGATTTTGAFVGVNNFVTDTTIFELEDLMENAAITNSYDFAKERIQACQQVIEEGVYYGDDDINMIYVDFWSVGDIVQVVQEHNRDLGVYNNNSNQTRQR